MGSISTDSSPPLRVLGLQPTLVDAVDGAGRMKNLETAKSLILKNPGYDVYLCPEMSSVGYNDDVLKNVDALLEIVPECKDTPDTWSEADSPSFVFFSALAKEAGAHICFGFPRKRSPTERSDRPAISQGVVGPQGQVVGFYDKLHLCNMGVCSEGSVFDAGEHLFTFSVKGYTLGVLICYDLRFPEIWRRLCDDKDVNGHDHDDDDDATKKAGLACDAILHPSAFPRDGAFPSYHAFIRTRAMENQCYVLSVNRAGSFFGGSITHSPWTDMNAEADLGVDEGVVEMVIDRQAMAEKRRDFPLRIERRVDYESMKIMVAK